MRWLCQVLRLFLIDVWLWMAVRSKPAQCGMVLLNKKSRSEENLFGCWWHLMSHYQFSLVMLMRQAMHRPHTSMILNFLTCCYWQWPCKTCINKAAVPLQQHSLWIDYLWAAHICIRCRLFEYFLLQTCVSTCMLTLHMAKCLLRLVLVGYYGLWLTWIGVQADMYIGDLWFNIFLTGPVCSSEILLTAWIHLRRPTGIEMGTCSNQQTTPILLFVWWWCLLNGIADLASDLLSEVYQML